MLSLAEEERDIVSAADVIELLGSETTARSVVRNLVRKGWLTRLVGGRYMVLPPSHGPENLGENNVIALASAAVEPSYVGWWSAAAFHGMTTQRPRLTTVAVLKPRDAVAIEGHPVRFVHLPSRKFFGFTTFEIYDRTAQLSTPSKTAVDCVDRPSLAGGPSEVARIIFSASRTVNPADLVTDALQMGSRSMLQRLGFLIDLVGWDFPEVDRSQLRQAVPLSMRSVFGRKERQPDDIGYVSEWGLFVHATRSDLLADVPRLKRGDH
ncbi:type IV toxin-antitoxin system AbiEi family antitoxin [Sphingobium xenophagum]|nr:type IV toxin-antitoxin system AbiEi family antitoxin [Sphingobium xenophagum]